MAAIGPSLRVARAAGSDDLVQPALVPVVEQTSMARFAQRQTVGYHGKIILLTPGFVCVRAKGASHLGQSATGRIRRGEPGATLQAGWYSQTNKR